MPNTRWFATTLPARLFWLRKRLTSTGWVAFRKSGKKRPRYAVAWA